MSIERDIKVLGPTLWIPALGMAGLAILAFMMVVYAHYEGSKRIERCENNGHEWRDDGIHEPYCYYGDEQETGKTP